MMVAFSGGTPFLSRISCVKERAEAWETWDFGDGSCDVVDIFEVAKRGLIQSGFDFRLL